MSSDNKESNPDTASSRLVDVRLLLSLPDFKTMGDEALVDIASHAHVRALKPGDRLQASDETEFRSYLLAGEVDLLTQDKIMQNIRAGSERAQVAILRVYTPGLYILARKPCSLLSVERETFKKHFVAVEQDDSITLEELPDEEAPSEHPLIAKIGKLFHTRQINLPSMMDAAQRIQAAMNDPNADFGRVASIIQTDPVIAARIVQVANSAMYKTGKGAESVRDAITRIGIEATRAIVVCVLMRSLFKPGSALVTARIQRFYEHSIRIGVLCQVIAAHLKRFDPGHAFLAGLVHDIGIVPLLIVAEGEPELLTDAAKLEGVLDDLCPTAGVMLLRQWGFENDLIVAAEFAEAWWRTGVTEADYCDVVQAAQLHNNLLNGGAREGPALNAAPAFKRLGLDQLDPKEGVRILQESKREIAELVNLLLG